ncbi:MAG: single-stranded DNA-binding protein [Candidatus Magasanikbacteria bacterium CG11_big_fil_rev_8_21_14_0_20_39_34]|uniref:Single-stranded DNA-binding protein n=1 Tax=Candidatus Magasanikbacteria bacterium CG11_big_fil_rev_8_21_14_0_20_39_34 TaxID=1974653 RepID=A0A2H0N487_9BACT|nr:MAG: single-stranded DNA-binding protein [Candidatus Magasanikbacteria bacterium CG11_big_fil_rev_8_21_14_0_20_39_34]
MDLNRATIIGRLTHDPEVKTTPSGQTVCTISLATNRAWTDNSGQKQEKSEFHNCVLWGKLAEIAGQYLSKGRRAYIEGRLQTRDWVGQDGVKRYRTEIVAENMIMLDGPKGSGTPNSGNFSSQNTSSQNMQSNDDFGNSVVEEEIKVEDIPF